MGDFYFNIISKLPIYLVAKFLHLSRSEGGPLFETRVKNFVAIFILALWATVGIV